MSEQIKSGDPTAIGRLRAELTLNQALRQGLSAANDELRTQNAELLAALRRITDASENYCQSTGHLLPGSAMSGTCDAICEAIQPARAAIARATATTTGAAAAGTTPERAEMSGNDCCVCAPDGHRHAEWCGMANKDLVWSNREVR